MACELDGTICDFQLPCINSFAKTNSLLSSYPDVVDKAAVNGACVHRNISAPNEKAPDGGHPTMSADENQLIDNLSAAKRAQSRSVEMENRM